MRIDAKTLIVVMVYVACGVAGDLCLKDGMRQMPPMDGVSLGEIGRMFQHVGSTPVVLLGVLFLSVNFGMLLWVMSLADLSVVGPARALCYLLLTVFAWGALGEHIPTLRWIGVALITVGVGLVLSTHSAPEETTEDAVQEVAEELIPARPSGRRAMGTTS